MRAITSQIPPTFIRSPLKTRGGCCATCYSSAYAKYTLFPIMSNLPVLSGPMCGTPLGPSWHTCLTHHRSHASLGDPARAVRRACMPCHGPGSRPSGPCPARSSRDILERVEDAMTPEEVSQTQASPGGGTGEER